MLKLHFFDPAQEQQPQKTIYRVANWAEYNQSLIQRGSLMLWIDQQAITEWYHNGINKLGGLYRYSDACIRCALSLKAVLKLAFRQTQGLIQSLLTIMKIDLKVPSYTQLCRRQAQLSTDIKPLLFSVQGDEGLHIVVDSTDLKVYGEGEWKVRKHGASKRRVWRKLHLADDVATRMIEAVELTTNSITDAQAVEPLLDQITASISTFGGDGAYDQLQVYDALQERTITPIIPPRSNAIVWTDEAGVDLEHPRNEALKVIDELGFWGWKQHSRYHQRSLAETLMFRWKSTFGERLQSRKLTNQQYEVRIKAACLNRFTQLGRPRTVRKKLT
ncbi:IS5 family transposase [Runella sp.]|uniref:IS5 family transposase n=1 Tax=Runella sp. TaxID=1960881 RepID=UPI003D12DF46